MFQVISYDFIDRCCEIYVVEDRVPRALAVGE